MPVSMKLINHFALAHPLRRRTCFVDVIESGRIYWNCQTCRGQILLRKDTRAQACGRDTFRTRFPSGDTTVRVQKVETVVTLPYTALGWEVTDIATAVQHLTSRGVKFQRFEGLSQDELGIWLTPDGAQVAWFHDADGNTLSLTEP